MEITKEEKELMLDRDMLFIRNWNPNTQTVLDLKYVYLEAERLTEELGNTVYETEILEFENFYEEPHNYKDPSPTGGEDIKGFLEADLEDDNRIIASDFKGYCFLFRDVLPVYELGGETKEYVIRNVCDVWSDLEETAHFDDICSKDD